MKLEVGKTYATRPNLDGSMGRAFKMNGMQEFKSWLYPTFRVYREFPGSTDYWTEDGRHSSGNDALRLVMEMPEAAPAPTPAPAVKLGKVLVEIDLDTMTAQVRKP